MASGRADQGLASVSPLPGGMVMATPVPLDDGRVVMIEEPAHLTGDGSCWCWPEITKDKGGDIVVHRSVAQLAAQLSQCQRISLTTFELDPGLERWISDVLAMAAEQLASQQHENSVPKENP